MDKKVLYALTTKIFNTLKKLGIKPKIGVTTDIQRLPGANSFNTDLSTLTQARPESLKKVITADADFLAKANPDELRQYYNNLEYVQATYPDIFSKPQVVTEAKTGIKTLVDDLNENLKGKKSMETVNLKTGEVTSPKEPITIAEKQYFYDKDQEYNKLLTKHKKAAEAHDQLDNIDIYDKIAPDQLGEVIAEMSGKNVDSLTDAQRREYYKIAQSYLTDFIKVDRTRRAVEKVNKGLELTATDRLYLKFAQPTDSLPTTKSIDISDEKTAEAFTNFARENDPEGFKKIQKIVDDINNKNTLEDFDVKDREPNAKGGSVGNLTYKKMFGDLDKTLNKGLGTMFKKRRR